MRAGDRDGFKGVAACAALEEPDGAFVGVGSVVMRSGASFERESLVDTDLHVGRILEGFVVE